MLIYQNINKVIWISWLDIVEFINNVDIPFHKVYQIMVI